MIHSLSSMTGLRVLSRERRVLRKIYPAFQMCNKTPWLGDGFELFADNGRGRVGVEGRGEGVELFMKQSLQ